MQNPALAQTGMHPMAMGMQQPAAPAAPGAHPALSQTGIRPMPGYGAPQAGGSPFPQHAGMGQGAHAQQPAGMGGMPQAGGMQRPQPQSTRLKPRSQTVTITPTAPKSGKGKWVVLTLLLLGGAGAAAAYFLELI
ncbi:MAG: hypothetical protein R3E96_00490 [Planctomycetota bacterium]